MAGDGGEFGDAHVATSVDEGAGGGFVHVSTGAEDGGDDVEAGFGPVAEKEAVFADKGVGVCGGDEGSEVSKPGDSTEGLFSPMRMVMDSKRAFSSASRRDAVCGATAETCLVKTSKRSSIKCSKSVSVTEPDTYRG